LGSVYQVKLSLSNESGDHFLYKSQKKIILTEHRSNDEQYKKIYWRDNKDIQQTVLPERQVGVDPKQVKQGWFNE